MKKSDCVFCNINEDKIIMKNELAFVIDDKFPHSKGHVLIIPVNHIENYFDLTRDEQNSMSELMNRVKEHLNNKYAPSAYNVSINVGKAAGQIVMHTHIHLIPRYN